MSATNDDQLLDVTPGGALTTDPIVSPFDSVGGLPASRNEPGGHSLDIGRIPSVPEDRPSVPLSLDVSGIPARSEPEERFTEIAEGVYRANYPKVELEDLTPAFRALVGDNLMLARQMLFWAPDTIGDNLQRAALVRMQKAGAEAEGLRMTPDDLRELTAASGMTEEELRYWKERDPDRIANQITDKMILRALGPHSYTVGQLQNPQGAARFREDRAALAAAEAWMLGTWTDGWTGALERGWYDLRVGVGQVGSFSMQAAAGLTRLFDDTAQGADEAYAALRQVFVRDDDYAERNSPWLAQTVAFADRTREAALNAQAEWLGPPIDTGNPTLDWMRTAVFQGSPFLVGTMGLAIIPGVGPSGAAAIIGTGMGAEAAGDVREAGGSPRHAIIAGVGSGLVSYYLNTFQLERWTRNLAGRSPFRRFSVGTLVETAEEMLSEAGEEFGQGLFTVAGKLMSAPGYTREDAFLELRERAEGAMQEGGAAGFLALVTRIPGAPKAVRGQLRDRVFFNGFQRTGEKLAGTKVFKEAPGALAEHFNGAARHHGGAGILFASVYDLEQGGLTRETLTKPVQEGGLGIAAAEYDLSKRGGIDLVVPYGNAVVFSQMQKDAGNEQVYGLFRSDPDAMTGREILEYGREITATLDQAEVNYKALAEPNGEAVPLRIKILRAGLRAGNMDVHEADALASVYWAQTQRFSEMWGITPEEYLDRKDVQLDIRNMIQNAREVARYERLLEKSRRRYDEADGLAAELGHETEAAADESVSEAAQAEPVPAAETAVRNDVLPPLEPVRDAEGNRQWVEAAADTIADGLGVDGGEREAVVQQARELLDQAAGVMADQGSATTEDAGPATGRQIRVTFPAETGTPALSAHYQLVEMDTLKPSHTFRNYTPNPVWTSEELAQQRNYDSGAMQAARESIELDRLNYDVLFNPSTDAVNGPPIVTEAGKILGGNNRSHRIYNRYDLDAYRENLVAHLDSGENMTGIAPEAALAMQRPVLVRVVSKVEAAAVPGLVGALNADFTTRRDPANLAANRGMRVGDKTLAAFAAINDGSVSAYLDSPSTARRVLQAMVADGALQGTDLPSLYDFAGDRWLGDGRNSGKAQVEQALFGAVLPDSRLLNDLSDGMKRKLMRALPGLIRLRRNNAPELGHLFDAIALHNEYQTFRDSAEVKGLKPAAKLEMFRKPNQLDLFTGEAAPEKGGPAWEMFLELNGMKTQREVAEFFTRKADELSGTARGLFDLQQERVAELYQDGGKPVPVVSINPSLLVDNQGSPIDLRDTAALKRWIIERYSGQEVTIENDGLTQVFRPDRLRASLKKRGEAQRQVYSELDVVMEKAVYDDFEPTDAKHEKQVSGQNIYYSAVNIDGKYFGVRFKIDMLRHGQPSYKDHKVSLVIEDVAVEVLQGGEKNTAPPLDRRPFTDESADASTQQGGAALDTVSDEDIHSISLPVLKGLVNPSSIRDGVLYQNSSEKSAPSRGRILFPEYFSRYGGDAVNIADAPHIIQLFKGADVSTVYHELNHLFVRDLETLVSAGRGGETARADLAALTKFAGGTLDRAGYEKIAQAAERYAMEGRAPSPELADAFDVFRTYISRVYDTVTRQLGVEPSPEVRSVFDRFLATDEEIAAARDLDGKREYWEDFAFQNNPARDRVKESRQRAAAAERTQADARHGGGQGLREASSLAAVRARIRGEAANDPGYRAIDRAKKDGGFKRTEVESLTSQSVADAIAARHGENVFGEGAGLDRVARESGFQTTEEMLSALSGLHAFDDHVNARMEEEVRRRMEEDGRRDRDDFTSEAEIDPEEVSLVEQIQEAVKDSAGARGVREWRLKYQAMKTAAARLVGPMALRDAVDYRRFQKAKREANGKALRAAKRLGTIAGREQAAQSAKAGEVKRAKRRDALREARQQTLEEVTLHLNEELMHHLTIREGMRARALRERMEKRYSTKALLSAIEGGKHQARVENDYAEAVKAVATFVGLTDSRKLRPQKDGETIPFPTYEEKSNVADFLPDFAGSVEPWLANKIYPENYVDWQDFSYDQIQEVDRVLTMLINKGRGELNALREGEERYLEELVADSLRPLARRDPRAGIDHDDRTWTGRVLNKANQYLVSLTVPEYWFMMMDGNPTIKGKEAGRNQRLFWKMRECQVVKDQLYKKLLTRLEPHFNTLEQAKADLESRFGGRRFDVAGLPFPDILKKGLNYHHWDADLLLSIALQMGNDASLYRLTGRKVVDGKLQVDYREDCFNFTDAELQTVAGLFTAEQWQAIQAVWDGVGSLYPELDRVTFNITNRHVVREQPQPFTVRTLDGQTLALKGGYYPLVNDGRLNTRADKLRESSTIEDAIHAGLMDNVHQSSKPAAGMIKERLRDENGNPVVRLPQRLGTDLLVRHLDASTHYISHAEAILEFDRLTRNETWREEFSDKFGQERYRAIRNWVQDLARPTRQNNEPGQQILEKLRTLATINALGLRPTTAAKQQLGMFQAAAFMSDASRTGVSGWKYLKKGWREVGWGGLMGRKTEKMKLVDSWSGYMATRDGSHDREINAAISRLSPLDRQYRVPFSDRTFNKRDIHDAMFWMVQTSDRMGAYATWLGAYHQAMDGNANFDITGMTDSQRHAEAVLYADSAAATQASSFLADLTAAQKSTGIMRFVSMFMSGNIRQGSRLMQYIDAYNLGDKTGGNVANLAFREFVAPAMAWVLLAAVIKAGLGADDDSLLSEAVWETAETVLAPFPIIREASSVLQYGSEGSVPALASPAKAVTKGVRSVKRAATGEYDKALADAADAAGFWLGIPFTNLLRQTRPLSEAVGLVEKSR